jgi:hypothetical protein
MRSLRIGLLATLLIGILATVAPAALANGGAVKIPLKYLPSVSNWGPTTATGIGSVDVSDGEVIVTVYGLPQLGAERYEGWLITGADLVSVGRFNADATGAIQFRVILERLPARKYDLFLITVEPEPDTDAKPSAQRSIGGYFNPLMATPTGSPSGSGNPTPGSQPGATPTKTPVINITPPYTAPASLPNTGEMPTGDELPGAALLAMAVAAAAVSVALAARKPCQAAIRTHVQRRRRS